MSESVPAHSTIARITTPKASGYLQQLCKHFAHKIDVTFTPQSGMITFTFGVASLVAAQDILEMQAQAGTTADLNRLQNVLTSHLERFAFREDFNIEWSK